MKKTIDFLYGKLAKFEKKVNKKDKNLPGSINYLFDGTNYWRLAFYSSLMGLTIAISEIWISVTKQNLPFTEVFGRAILFGSAGFLIFFSACSIGKFLGSTKKLSFEKKKLIVVLTWLAIVIVFLLPFVLVHVFGFE